MTKRLDEAIAAISQLPEKDQDAIATTILEKISEQRASVPSPLSQTDIETLERFYTIRDKTEVITFLEKHPFLLPPLLEAPAKIRQYFPEKELVIEVSYDPEIIDYVHLVLSILTKDDSDDVVDKLNQLDKDWGLTLSYPVRQKFFTTLGYPDEF